MCGPPQKVCAEPGMLLALPSEEWRLETRCISALQGNEEPFVEVRVGCCRIRALLSSRRAHLPGHALSWPGACRNQRATRPRAQVLPDRFAVLVVASK